MITNSNLINGINVSCFMFYDDTKEQFEEIYNNASQEEKDYYDQLIIFIKNEETDRTVETEENIESIGCIRACGRYYTPDILELKNELKEYTDNAVNNLEETVRGEISESIKQYALDTATSCASTAHIQSMEYTDSQITSLDSSINVSLSTIDSSISGLTESVTDIEITLSNIIPISDASLEEVFES